MKRKVIEGILDLFTEPQRLVVLRIYHYGFVKSSDVRRATREALVAKKYVVEHNGVLDLPDSVKKAVQSHLSIIKKQRNEVEVERERIVPNVPAPTGMYSVC